MTKFYFTRATFPTFTSRKLAEYEVETKLFVFFPRAFAVRKIIFEFFMSAN